MLTLKTQLKAMTAMSSYGLGAHHFGAGFVNQTPIPRDRGFSKPETRTEVPKTSRGKTAGNFVRRFNEIKGIYEYVPADKK